MPRSRWISDLHWVRKGQQSRSQKTQEALLAAAAVLFSEKGLEATSVAEVAARAGCTIGALYHHFRDKQALVYAVLDRMSEELRATAQVALDPARWREASLTDILRGYLEFSLELGRDRPAVKSAVLQAARSDPAVREHLVDLYEEIDEALIALLLSRRDEIGHPDPDLAIRLVLEQLSAMLSVRLNETPAPSRLANRSDEEFVREALRSACAYLGC